MGAALHLRSSLLLIAVAVGLVACSNGLGAPCARNSDCGGGLVCSADRTCTHTVDASLGDASPDDATTVPPLPADSADVDAGPASDADADVDAGP